MKVSARARFCVVVWLSIVSRSGAAEVIDGYVVNPLTDERVGDIEVGFSIAGADGTFSEMMRKSTDAEGRFSFSGPFLANGLTYSLTAHYRDIPYSSSTLEVGAQHQVILEVFDPTVDPAGVHASAHHLFLTIGTELLEVAQLMQVHNSGDATFVGVHDGGKTNLVTELNLPDGVFNFRTTGQQQNETGAFVHQHGSFFHTDPILPGRTQIAFTFQIDLAQFTGTYQHVAPYDTDRLDIYLQPASIELGPPFHDLGQVTLHDQSYRRYHVDDLARAQTLAIPLPMSRPIRWILKWVALGLALFASLASLVLARHTTPRAPDTTSTSSLLAGAAGVDANADIRELEQMRHGLLVDLASTDSQAQSAKHQQLTNRAVALYRLLALKKG